MIWLGWFLIILAFGYAATLIYFYAGWVAHPEQHTGKDPLPHTFSIIIAARNEAQNIPQLITDLSALDYPPSQWEAVIVDDHSTDNTLKLANSSGLANVKCLSLAEYLSHEEEVFSYKKKAIESGIAHSRHDIIITTDADCRIPSGWLRATASAYQLKGVVLTCGPVVFNRGRGLLHQFQLLDLLGLMAITGGAFHHRRPFLANGANLSYKRSAFKAVKGFEAIEEAVSGDDMLLMEKIRSYYPGRNRFVKDRDAVVSTDTLIRWKEFLHQRLRWTSKTSYYQNENIRFILIMAYLFNLLMVVAFLIGLIEPWMFTYLLAALGLKFIAEWILISASARFFNRKNSLIWFLPASILHIAYILTIGFLANFRSYRWKERTYS